MFSGAEIFCRSAGGRADTFGSRPMHAGVPFDWIAAVSRAENESLLCVIVSVMNSERSCAVVLPGYTTAAKRRASFSMRVVRMCFVCDSVTVVGQ